MPTTFLDSDFEVNSPNVTYTDDSIISQYTYQVSLLSWSSFLSTYI